MSVSSYLDELSRGLIIRDEEKESIKWSRFWSLNTGNLKIYAELKLIFLNKITLL
ncbi:hypothetical protein EXW53_06355 [Bacillus mycoides]|uniref:hypothetical protein n=1 Tax=Bacillus mycoides TaxID=1405 RepID=UPI001C034E50|nr:hypothetical protein [Bacillus mycoides]QWH41318.1 hypothetical protein EXW53_06355 [Bacillus mycoides]